MRRIARTAARRANVTMDRLIINKDVNHLRFRHGMDAACLFHDRYFRDA